MSLSKIMMMESRLTKVLWEMERTGIKIDPIYCAEAGKEEVLAMKEATREFKNLTGRDFKDSNKLFVDVFTERGPRS